MDKKSDWVLVETVEMFRMRYLVQVPKGKKDYALDMVTIKEAKEFSQKYIGETIVSHRIITEKEALALADEDNDYAKSWDKNHKIEAFFTREGEKAE